jgi:TRAP-type C4-dicarboxylate transport system substrate-binding protein
MRRTGICCLIALFLPFVLLAGVSYGADKAIKLEFASYLPAQEGVSMALQEWSREIEKKTGGRVAITFHPGGTLVPMMQTYDSVASGMADIGFAQFANSPGRFPMMELLDYPLGLKTSAASWRLAREYVDKFKPKELSDVKVLFLVSTTPAVVHTKKPVNKLEDLKGRKVRTLAGPMVTALKLLGAVPVVIPTVDVYDSASKGVIEGTLSAIPGMVTFKWGEVLPNTVNNYRTSNCAINFAVMNKDKWNSLPPDIQQIIDKTSDEYWDKVGKVWDQMTADAIRTLTTAKHSFVSLSAAEEERWAKQIAPLYDTYVKEKSAKGLPAAEAMKFVQDWVKKNQK